MKRMFPGLLMICLLSVSAARGDDLRTAIQRILESDSQMKAANADTEAARLRYKARLGEMFPTIEVEGSLGNGEFDTDWPYQEIPEREYDPALDNSFYNTNTSYSTVSLRLVQPITFFGGQRTAKNRGWLTYQRAHLDAAAARQDLVLEAVSSYLRLKQAEEEVKYAQSSADNIKQQADMEVERVDKGAGVSTDVLQAKAQLLQAETGLMRAKGQLIVAQNSAERVFSMPAEKISALTKVDLASAKIMPAGLAATENLALKSSQQIKIARLVEDGAREALSTRRWLNAPRVNGVLEWTQSENLSGSDRTRDEQKAQIEVVYDFNMGLSSISETRAAGRQVEAARERVVDEEKKVLEEVRNAWQNLITAKETAAISRKQEAIAEEFLTMARKERTLGRRSLLDVLNGEKTLIDARSAAAAAEADIEIYTYQLLRAIGVLDVAPVESDAKKK